MATIPLWAIGKHIVSCLLTPQTVNTTSGLLSATTPTVQFFGHLQDVELTSEFDMENISSMDRPYRNMVPIEQGTQLVLTEHEKSAGTNLAAYAAFNGEIYMFTLARGQQTFTGYGRIASYRMPAGKRGIPAQLRLDPIDIGTPQPTYT